MVQHDFDSLFNTSHFEFEFNKFDALIHLYPQKHSKVLLFYVYHESKFTMIRVGSSSKHIVKTKTEVKLHVLLVINLRVLCIKTEYMECKAG